MSYKDQVLVPVECAQWIVEGFNKNVRHAQQLTHHELVRVRQCQPERVRLWRHGCLHDDTCLGDRVATPRPALVSHVL